MKNASAWMPLYIGDYLADTMGLTTEQHGAYVLLLMNEWRNGPLPRDHDKLAMITRSSRRAWDVRIWPALSEYFVETSDGLVQKRLERERAAALSHTEKRSIAGKIGAKSRWQSHSNRIAVALRGDGPSPSPSESDASSLHSEADTASLPSSGDKSPSSEATLPQSGSDAAESPSSPAARAVRAPRSLSASAEAEGFSEFYSAFPRHVGRRGARKAYASALKRGADAATLLAAVEAQVAAGTLDRGRYTPHPSTWLNEDRWLDEPAESDDARALRAAGLDPKTGEIASDAPPVAVWPELLAIQGGRA